MNKKIASIISGIIILLAGSGVAVANIDTDNDSTDTSVSESYSEPAPENVPETVSETTAEIITEITTEIITETVPETVIESATESLTEIFSEEESHFMDEEPFFVQYRFRSEKLLNQHFEKHGSEFEEDFNYQTAIDYEKGANNVINNPHALFKYEAEDGDSVYYIEASNEFVILSTDGYIRTYFRPTNGIDYFNKQ